MAEIKRILFVHRYFHPDTPTYAYLLSRIADRISQSASVNVITSMPSYYGSSSMGVPKIETKGNLHIKRLSLLKEGNRNFVLRLINSVLFAYLVFWNLIKWKNRYDVIQVATTPPILISLTARLACILLSKKSFVYHCQDIYPDIAKTMDIGHPKDKPIHRLAKRIDAWIMKGAHRIVVLSEDMKNHLIESRGIDSAKIKIINNFIPQPIEGNYNTPSQVSEKLKDFTSSHEKNYIFSGNVGVFQDLDRICSAFSNLKNIGFVIVGEGNQREYLEKKYSLNSNILFVGYLDKTELPQLYEYFEAGLAPILMGVEKLAFPSKIIGYISEGLPVISFSSENSSIEKFIEQGLGSNSTLAIDDDVEKFMQLIKSFSSLNSRTEIKKIAYSILGENTILNEWEQLYKNI